MIPTIIIGSKITPFIAYSIAVAISVGQMISKAKKK